jgi:integrase
MAARKALAAEVAKRDRGERVAADPRLRFDAAADAWHEARVLRLRPNSQATYGYHLKHLREHFGRWRMTDISPADVAKYVTAKENAGRAGKTIGAHLNVLSAVFDYAIRHFGLASTNPVASLDRVERPSGARKREPYVLTPSELTRLLAAVENDYRLMVELAAQTGARVAEALGFAWEDLDLDVMTVSFTHQLQDKRRVTLKTKASKATLEIAPSLAAKLRAHRLASARSGPGDLVFTGRRGEPLDDYNVSYGVMGRAARKAGIVCPDDKRLSFHCLRHGFSSSPTARTSPRSRRSRATSRRARRSRSTRTSSTLPRAATRAAPASSGSTGMAAGWQHVAAPARTTRLPLSPSISLQSGPGAPHDT